MIGLNVPQAITSQVAHEGFQSLTPAQRGQLSDITCNVDDTYMAFIRRAYGAHAHGDLAFNRFCEAQLVWDNAMAVNALDFIHAHPADMMVIITGNGHAWKGGIPTRIAERSPVPVSVILTGIAGASEPDAVNSNDADYLFLNNVKG